MERQKNQKTIKETLNGLVNLVWKAHKDNNQRIENLLPLYKIIVNLAFWNGDINLSERQSYCRAVQLYLGNYKLKQSIK